MLVTRIIRDCAFLKVNKTAPAIYDYTSTVLLVFIVISEIVIDYLLIFKISLLSDVFWNELN